MVSLSFAFFIAGAAPELVLQSGHQSNVVAQPAVHPGGRLLATGDGSGRLYLWDMSTRKLLRLITLDAEYPSAMTFSADGATLIVTTTTVKNVNSVLLIEPSSGEVKRRFSTQRHAPQVAMSPDASDVFLGGALSGRVLDTKTARIVWTKGVTTGSVSTPVAASPAGVAAFGGHVGALYDWKKKQEIGPLPGAADPAFRVALSRSGKIFARADQHDVTLFALPAGTPLAQLSAAPKNSGTRVAAIAFSEDETAIVVAVRGWESNTSVSILRYDLAKAAVTSQLVLSRNDARFGKGLENVALSQNGTMVFAELHDRDFGLWDAASGAELGFFRGRTTGAVEAVRFSHDNRWLLSGGGKFDPFSGFLHVWSLETGRIVHAIEDLPFPVGQIELSADQKTVYFMLDNRAGQVHSQDVHALDLATHTRKPLALKQQAKSLHLSDDGKALLLYKPDLVNAGAWSVVKGSRGADSCS